MSKKKYKIESVSPYARLLIRALDIIAVILIIFVIFMILCSNSYEKWKDNIELSKIIYPQYIFQLEYWITNFIIITYFIIFPYFNDGSTILKKLFKYKKISYIKKEKAKFSEILKSEFWNIIIFLIIFFFMYIFLNIENKPSIIYLYSLKYSKKLFICDLLQALFYFSMTFLIIDIITLLISKKRVCIHDYLSNTFVARISYNEPQNKHKNNRTLFDIKKIQKETSKIEKKNNKKK